MKKPASPKPTHAALEAEVQRLHEELAAARQAQEAENSELAELEVSRTHYADLYDFAPVGYASLDRHGCLTDVNLTGAGLLGRPREELVGRPLLPLLAEGDRHLWLTHLRSLRSEAHATVELRLAPAGAEPRVLRFHTARLAARELYWDSPSALRTVFLDVTAQRRAEESIGRLVQFPEENPNPVLRASAEGGLLYANGPARALLPEMGWTPDGPLPQALGALVAEAAEPGRVIEREMADRRGRTFWFSAVRPAGEPYVNLYALDVTELVEAHQALREREGELRLVMNTVPALMAYIDAEFRYRRVNDGYERWFGLSPQEVEGRHVRDVIGEAAWELVRPSFERAMGGETVSYEEQMPYRLGIERWVAATLVPHRDAAGRVRGVVTHVTDISERKEAGAALLAERDFAASLVDSLPGVFYLFDEEGQFLRWNKNFERVSGHSAEELSRLRPWELFEGEHRRLIEERVREVFARGQSTAEAPFATGEGRDRPYFFTGLRILVRGKPCLVGMGVDITERKRAEAALREANEDMAHFNQVAVGRELRMIELKEEVNELCAQAGLPPRHSLDFDEPQAPPPEGASQGRSHSERS